MWAIGQQVGKAELGGGLDQECRLVAADEPAQGVGGD